MQIMFLTRLSTGFALATLLLAPLTAAYGQSSTVKSEIAQQASVAAVIAQTPPDRIPSALNVPEDRWEGVLKSAEAYVDSGAVIPSQTTLYAELLGDVSTAAAKLRTRSSEASQELESLITALGAAPDAEKNETEPAEVASQRDAYQAELNRLKAAIARADVAVVRVGSLRIGLAGMAREQLALQLNRRAVAPWRLENLRRGLKEVATGAAKVFMAPAAWRQSLSPTEWSHFAERRLPVLLVGVLAAIIISLTLRSYLKRRYGYERGVHGLTKARRLGAAVVRMIADGLMPALVLTLVYVWAKNMLDGQGAPLFMDMLRGAVIALATLAMSLAGISAAVAPSRREWRLLPVSSQAASAIRRRAMAMAIIVAIDLFLWTALANDAKSPEFVTMYAIIACTTRALALIPLLRGNLWRLQAYGQRDPDEPRRASRFWLLARLVAGGGAFASVIAALLGYADLALFVARGLTASIVIFGGLFLLRGAIHEAISTTMQTDTVLDWIGVGKEAAETLSFWVRLLLDPLFIAAAVILLGPFWGLTQLEMLTRANTFLRGFKIGDVTISLTSIGIGLLVFIIMLALIRAIQRAMLTNLLPRTRLDIGAQHSLTTGFGYLGAVISIMIAISTLGIDLSSLAIVAGALSVGIGFGLQSIVNNFVSGLILLVERPVKVGDWVVVGEREGIVKRIAIRATEVETFDRSSVIIPNSDLISNAVINRTHKDRIGRIDIPIGVAYGADTRKINDLLIEIGNEHEEVISMPEPYVLFIEFGASSLDFELRCYTDNNIRRLRISTEIRHQIHARFAEEGIEIPFPQRVVHLASAESAPAVPTNFIGPPAPETT